VKHTRRSFIKTSAFVGAGLAVAGRRVLAHGDPIKNLRKFVASLPMPGPTGISLASPNTTLYQGTDYYRIVMGQYRQQMHPDLPPTKLWGYADATKGPPRFRYLGSSIVATKGRPVRIAFQNMLPPVHPLPVDTTIPGAETGQLVNRAAVHLHGGFVPWTSDGGPFHWFAPNGTHGPSWMKWLPDSTGKLTADDLWPNDQTARLMWYHDHAVGITRLNAYAGLAAAYVLVDDDEQFMFGAGGIILPGQLPGIPLVLQDKSFKSFADQFGNKGDLDYPSSYGPAEPDSTGTPPTISCVPEFFADTVVINGMAFPQLTLPQGVHRFRMLNGTQSRVWNLQLYKEDRAKPGDPNLHKKGPNFIQIGTEGGFLPAPVVVPSGNQFNVTDYFSHAKIAHGPLKGAPSGYGLVLGGAERADVLIDFSEASGSFILYNDAPAPFPFGDDEVDYYTGHMVDGVLVGAPDSEHGPNTRTLMRITITDGRYDGLAGTELLDRLTRVLDFTVKPKLGLIVDDADIGTDFDPYPRSNHRIKTLNEGVDPFGRLAQFLGTGNALLGGAGGTVYGQYYEDAVDPIEDKYQAGDIETWDIYNTTGDVHPIHFHLVGVQVIGRARFVQAVDGNPEGGVFAPSGRWYPPDANERGFKETVRMNPGEVIRVVMKFNLPTLPAKVNNTYPITLPMSPRTGGHEYVWHCHILEHEEHDMMRPMVVL